MKGKEKTYVLDTSVLIKDPDIFDKLEGSRIVIPTAVIREIDALKRHSDPEGLKAKAVRKVTRTLDLLGSTQDIAAGARTLRGTIVMISNRYVVIDDLASSADNRIVGTALKLKEETGDDVILVTNDGNMRNVTRAYGIRAENYPLHRNGAGESTRMPIATGKISWNIIVAVMAVVLIALFLSAR